MAAPKNSKALVIRDEIHGDMSFEPVVKAAIDHRYFQRLRYIKQLGLAEYVFPCATHTRFQHSLGAAYLAKQYFDTILKAWEGNAFLYDGVCGQTKFRGTATQRCVGEVAADEHSNIFWRRIVTLSGLLHDIGHGPWSHTFEYLALRQNYSDQSGEIPGAIGEYFARISREKRALMHEDLSVLYIFQVMKDLHKEGVIENVNSYFVPIVTLVHRKMATGPEANAIDTDLEKHLKETKVKGGLDFHRLLGPLISGPFDVDRTDYIQRDGQNCGVHIAGIEWRRIMSKVIPCLAEHRGNAGEPKDVVLVSSIKNQHVIDDFIFTLFQMYAQVYMHPKIVGFEEVIKSLIAKKLHVDIPAKVDFESHSTLTDEAFRRMLCDEFGLGELEAWLTRKPGYQFEVARYPAESQMEKSLKEQDFRLIPNIDRPMLKDQVGVFLYSTVAEEATDSAIVRSWREISPLVDKLSSLNYSPNIWIRTDRPL